MDYKNLSMAVTRQVAWITIERPAAFNALDPDTMGEFLDAAERCATDRGVRAVVITGSGEKAFCAGDVAAERGAKVLALTLPDTLRTRLNLNSGFVLDLLSGSPAARFAGGPQVAPEKVQQRPYAQRVHKATSSSASTVPDLRLRIGRRVNEPSCMASTPSSTVRNVCLRPWV